MGDWESEADRNVLTRIVALLFALAGLADLAAGIPGHRRQKVLGFLSHGEAVARAFVIGMALGAPVEADEPAFADDAAGLAARLRGLALVLCVLLARWPALAGAAGPRIKRRKSAVSTKFRHPAALPAPDTS